MNAQTISTALKYDGDAIAQVFFDALTDANFHQETRVLHAAWEAMARAEYQDASDAPKLIAAARDALNNLGA